MGDSRQIQKLGSQLEAKLGAKLEAKLGSSWATVNHPNAFGSLNSRLDRPFLLSILPTLGASLISGAPTIDEYMSGHPVFVLVEYLP